jgi:hypothetical protein
MVERATQKKLAIKLPTENTVVITTFLHEPLDLN